MDPEIQSMIQKGRGTDRRRRGRCRLQQAALVAAVSAVGVAPRVALAHTPPHPLSNFAPPTTALDPNVSLSVDPTTLISSGEWVTVAFSGIESWRSPDAFVAAFSPGTVLDDPARIAEVAPVKYQFISASGPLSSRGTNGNVDQEGGGTLRGKPRVARGETVLQALRFRLLNLRDPEGYGFGLFTGGISNPVLVAKTEAPVIFARPYEVMHIHLALTDDPSSMRVSWVTGDASRAPAVRSRMVSTSLSKGQEQEQEAWQVTPAETATYSREDMCGAPATTTGFHDPGRLHSAVVANLVPGELYEYQAGDMDADVWAAASFFRASPQSIQAHRPRESVSGSAAAANVKGIPAQGAGGEEESGWRWGPEAVKVAVFGDMGAAEADGSLDSGHDEEPPSLKTVAIMKEQLGIGVSGEEEGVSSEAGDASEIGPDLQLVVHIGDLSYARGYDTQWDEYLDQISPVSSRVPWMIGVGNHERDFPARSASPVRNELSFYLGEDSGGDCGVPTAFRFIMPGEAADPLLDSPWYSFDFGPIHFTIMSTEHDFRPGSKQHEFLRADLAGVDRSKTPWVVFAGHRPMYVNSGGPGAEECGGDHEGPCDSDQPVGRLLRASLEDLLVENEVDLALYGHHHSYQRTCKVIDGVCKGMSSGRRGGVGGEGDEHYVAPVHVVLGMAGMGLSQNMLEPRPSWVEYGTDREYGLGMIVADRSTLKLTFILDSDKEVGDEIWLTRAYPAPPSPGTRAKSNRNGDGDGDLGHAIQEEGVGAGAKGFAFIRGSREGTALRPKMTTS